MASKRVLKSTGQNSQKLLKAYIDSIMHLHLHCNGIEWNNDITCACGSVSQRRSDMLACTSAE